MLENVELLDHRELVVGPNLPASVFLPPLQIDAVTFGTTKRYCVRVSVPLTHGISKVWS